MTAPRLSKRNIKLANNLAAISQEVLAPGDTVSIAVRVMPKGEVAGIASGAVGGVIGVIASSRILERSRNEIEPTGLPTDGQQVIGLTERALLFADRSNLTGTMKQLRLSLPLEDVGGVHHERGRMGDRLHLTLRCGVEVSYTCVKVDPGAAFAAAVTTLLESNRRPPPA